MLEWRWRVPAPREGEPPLGVTSSKSPVVRLSLAFHGDTAKLDFDDRAKLRLARALTAQGLPYASLIYVWMPGRPRGEVFRSPHTDRVRSIVVESGAEGVGKWRSYRRNVLEDYRKVFGEEPWDIVAVGLMTDADNTRQKARSYYGDITFLRAD